MEPPDKTMAEMRHRSVRSRGDEPRSTRRPRAGLVSRHSGGLGQPARAALRPLCEELAGLRPLNGFGGTVARQGAEPNWHHGPRRGRAGIRKRGPGNRNRRSGAPGSAPLFALREAHASPSVRAASPGRPGSLRKAPAFPGAPLPSGAKRSEEEQRGSTRGRHQEYGRPRAPLFRVATRRTFWLYPRRFGVKRM